MAVTQYIGARYVPVFYEDSHGGNAWESGVVYEPLTIVTYLNQSYTSKKPVPANISNPADEPDYWVLTGAYNAQIAQLSQDVDDLEANVNSREKIVSIGASINLDTAGQLSGGFPDKAFNAAGYQSGEYYNIAFAGAGFVAGAAGQKFIDQLQTVINNTSAEFKSGKGRIIITGGMNNDINNGATYLDAVDAFVALARANFPHFTIEFLPLSWSRQYTQRTALRTLYETYIKYMPDHGVDIWPECYAYMHNYTNWFRDNIHFNQVGIDVAARMFQKIITRSSCDFNPNEGLLRPFTPQNMNTTNFAELGNWTSIREYYDGNIVWLMGGDSMLKPVAGGLAVTNSIGSPMDVCDNPFHYISTTPFTDGNKYGEFPCSFRNYQGTEIMDGFGFIDTNNRLVFYARKSGFTLTDGGLNNLKFFYIGIPREFC